MPLSLLSRALTRVVIVAIASAAPAIVVVSPAGAAESKASSSEIAAPETKSKECKHPTGVASVLRPLSEVKCLVERRFRNDRPVTVSAASAPARPTAGGDEVPSEDELPTSACIPDDAASLDAEQLVVEIFGCRLAEAEWPEGGVRYTTAEALVVAECESKFDTDAIVFGGRYLDVPHANGNRYSAAGIFQFIRRTADAWIDGGYANVHDPARNIDAAARLYIHNIRAGVPGWGDWACAAVSDGFAKQSVLPGWPGGPAELPQWAFDAQG